ncbi:hypothetical protein ANCDUO_20017 [Ancylostoma duodenale]|uniref:Kinesin motor domain-containing protein n=1 Tax=Ancylostoma duodenale TaxID=51022 RepID=A0A0C2CJG6_9BILA|nr:hypothetical protein ANCDUO_20017 [Ancylostoma duodenale]
METWIWDLIEFLFPTSLKIRKYWSKNERQRDAGTEGDRMKEGIVINQSLSTLGRVIKALHEQQGSKGKKVQIPYRDSVLTCLLKNALGGNSKTIMVSDHEEVESLRRQLEQNQKEMAELEKTWQEKIAEEAAKVRLY